MGFLLSSRQVFLKEVLELSAGEHRINNAINCIPPLFDMFRRAYRSIDKNGSVIR